MSPSATAAQLPTPQNSAANPARGPILKHTRGRTSPPGNGADSYLHALAKQRHAHPSLIANRMIMTQLGGEGRCFF